MNTRGPAVLIAITYPLLAELTGLTLQSVRNAAYKGEFHAKHLDSTLCWVNSHRTKRGLSPLGLSGASYIPQTTAAIIPTINIYHPINSNYDPHTGDYQ